VTVSTVAVTLCNVAVGLYSSDSTVAVTLCSVAVGLYSSDSQYCGCDTV
jgi:hypothetical protein